MECLQPNGYPDPDALWAAIDQESDDDGLGSSSGSGRPGSSNDTSVGAAQQSASSSDLEAIRAVALGANDAAIVDKVAEGLLSHTEHLTPQNIRTMAELVVKAWKLGLFPNGLVRKAGAANPRTFSIGRGVMIFHVKGHDDYLPSLACGMRIPTVGRGAFKEVWKAVMVDLSTFEVRLVTQQKLIRDGASEEERRAFVDEAYRTANYRSDYVTAPAIHARNYTNQRTGEKRVVVYTDLYGDDLKKRLSDSSRPIDQSEAIEWAQNTTEGVASVHNAGDMHTDLKPENIVTDGPHARVADFGLAKPIGPTPSLSDIAYRAPESFQGKGQGTEADVWQLGQIFYELFHPQHQRPLFYRNLPKGPALGRAMLGVAVLSDEIHRKALFGGDWPLAEAGTETRAIQDLVGDCLHMDPAARPKLPEIRARLAEIRKLHSND